jgi:hypothetical protein
MTKAADKPYVIAAMVFLSRVEHQADVLMKLLPEGDRGVSETRSDGIGREAVVKE